MTSVSLPEPNDFSSKSTHFLQASATYLKIPMRYGASDKISGSKSPKGCYLSGEHVVYYVDDWLPVQVTSNLALSPSKVFQNQGRPLKIGTQISANKQYIGYCIQSGIICVYNRKTREQCLLQGHRQRVTDMAFCGDQVDLLASASLDGHVFIWSITETSGKDEQVTRWQITLSIQVLGEWGSVHPLICWRNQDLVIGIDKYVLVLTPEELKKNFVSSGFAFDNPIRCHVGNLIRGIKFAGVHDLEVTALTVISRCPTLIASASRDGTVRIWRDQEPVAVTRFAPYEGLPVDSVSCISPFENDLHVILTAGGPENRELKLWVPFDTACSVPATAIVKWKCIETVELKNSTDIRPCQLYFNRILRDAEASLLVVGSTQDSSIYVIHVEFEARSAYMDYLSKFCVELPISILTARSDSSGDGEGIVEIFCVHEDSIQMYTLHRSQCVPPAHNVLLDTISPTGSYGHPGDIDMSDPSGFSSADIDNYCTVELDEKAGPLSPASRGSNPLSSPSTSSGFGSWIEVPGLVDHLKDIRSAQSTDLVLQEQNTTGLTQINSTALASFCQQETFLDLNRKGSWKGTKNSPVSSMGKLPETVALTNFPTCTVPSLSVGQESLEIPNFDGKWNAKVCGSIDFKGCDRGYPDALNAVSSRIDHTNLYVRDLVLSSVTEETVTGQLNTALSSDFSDKKTVTMKNHKFQEMGQISEFNSWSMPSDMLSLGTFSTAQQDREEIVYSKSIETMTIEFSERSDRKCINDASVPGNLVLPHAQGKHADDGKINPFQMHGVQIVTSTGAVEGSFLVQSRRPVHLNPFETLAVCTSSVQESLCTLASMYAEFQNHISVAVEGSMSEQSNRLESCITEHFEQCLETYAEEMCSGFKETGTRNTEHNVLQHIAVAVSKNDFLSAVCENVCEEISSLGPAIARLILSHSERMETTVVKNMSQKHEIITNQLEESIAIAVDKHIIKQLQANFWSQTLQENIGSYFQEKILPLIGNLFRKEIERGKTLIQEKGRRYTSYTLGDLTSHLILVAFTLKEILIVATMDLISMEEELREGKTRLLDFMHCNAHCVLRSLSNGREVNDDHDRTFHTGHISRLVEDGNLEEAFTRTLSLGDVNAISWLCSQVDPSNIFSSNALPVSQLVLLFLMQQLACDLEREVTQKLSWIQEAATAMDPNDPTLSYYIRPVLEQVYLNLQRRLIQISPGSTLVNKIRLIMHVINSLLTSCR